MTRTVETDCGRYSLEYEADHGEVVPACWYQNGEIVPELPLEIEDELLDKAFSEVRYHGVDEAVDEQLDREFFGEN